MGKLVSIEGKQTKWEGLWWHPENNSFFSASLSLADIRKFKGNVRLYVRKNKYFNGGENGRPNYLFCFKDSQSDNARELNIEGNDETEKKASFTYDEMQDLINRVACCAGGESEYNEWLVSDFTDKYY